MATRIAIVGSAVGLHARPASLIANQSGGIRCRCFPQPR